MALIFTALTTGSGPLPHTLLESSQYQNLPLGYCKYSNVFWIIAEYFLVLVIYMYLRFKIYFLTDFHHKTLSKFSVNSKTIKNSVRVQQERQERQFNHINMKK